MATMGPKWLCLAAGLLILAGCDSMPRPGFLGGDVKVPAGVSFAALAANGQVSYALSVEEASVSLQDLLRRMGLPVTVTEGPSGSVRLQSFGPDNQEFTLVLQPDEAGSKTRVALEWEKASAGKKSLQILLLLEKTKSRPGK